MEQRDGLNERWEALCIQLGISYKKAEQTKYSLKLLEAQLTQLNKWMSSVERQITEISGHVSCDIDELSQQLVDLQVGLTTELFIYMMTIFGWLIALPLR